MRSRLALCLMLLVVGVGRAADFEVAQPGYHYQFPADDFSHPAYETEWWYYTGNLRASDGRRFGFELTFFREGVSREANANPWYVHDLWMAHLALSDIGGGRFCHAERLNRAGPGIAGVDASRGMIWNGNWQAHLDGTSQTLRADHHDGGGDFSLALALDSAKPRIIQGENGISRKGQGTGHASHYVSVTRLLTSGTVELRGTTYKVDGTSWMDHEFFTGSMSADEVGWDWVGLQLSDNTELMLYRLRHKDGSVDPYSSGSYVDAQGKATFLARSDFSMTPEGEKWTSPATRAAYPLSWQVAVPRFGLTLDLTAPLQEQELTSDFGPSYWEGAVDLKGMRGADPVGGVGYLEMTGYGAPAKFGAQ